MAITEKTTIGVEAEFLKLPMNTVDGLKHWLKCKGHDDGSLRGPTYVAGNLPVYPQEDAEGNPILSVGMQPLPKNAGLEIVTEPYEYRDMLEVMRKFAYHFASIPQSPRSSIHIHVDADRMTFNEIKRLLLWVHALEAPIFRIACGGLVHRGALAYNGEPNDHRYARPLSASIGCVWDHGELLELIDWNKIKRATNISALAAAWGRLDLYWNGGFDHYWPHRLHMINLSSILRQGTIEWRIFDGMYEYIDRFVEFVYRVHKLSESGEPDFHFPLGSTPDIDAAWMSKLLDMDVEVLWGINWQEPIKKRALRSHYAGAPTLLSEKLREINVINNGKEYDTGKENYQPFIRKMR